MKIKIEKGGASGTVFAPPSKSVAHRLLIAASLAEGESIIENVAYSEDILATLDCLSALGATVTKEESRVRIIGVGGKPRATEGLFCRESGSTLRFLLPLTLLMGGGELFGSERLIDRGVSVYEETLCCAGIEFEKKNGSISVKGILSAGHYILCGNVSSQFVSGMLFALSCLERDGFLEIEPPFESREYVDITVEALALFGVKIKKKSEFVYEIRGGQRYLPRSLSVEGDWSNAAFLYALDLLCGDVRVEGLREDSLQGDRVCRDLFARVGRETLDLSGCPDLAPILMAVAAAKGGGRFVGTRRLAIKESNRAVAMQAELAKVGIAVDVEENAVTVHGGTLHAPTEVIDSHNDHRIVMAMSVLGTLVGLEIEGTEAVRKSYPDFFEVLSSLGIEVQYEA